MSDRRGLLLKAVKLLSGLSLLAVLLVSLDFLIDFRPSNIQSSYRFTLTELPIDAPVFLRQDNLIIVVIRRSERLIETLRLATDHLQDRDSRASRQPEYAGNRLRSRHAGYFVAYGLGTDLGCPLLIDSRDRLRETCGSARYDFAGRALAGQKRVQNLSIPDYNFSPDFTILTVSP